MSDLTAKFAALEDQLAAQAATSDALVDTVEEKLQAIFDEIDTIIINNAVNTRALLAAMGQSAACFPCPTPSIVVPPLDTTPRTINTDKCKRTQAMIAAIHSILVAFDTMQSFDVIGTFTVINDAISEVVGAIAAGDTLPLPSFPEAVQIAGTYVSYAGERLFSGVGLIDQFAPLESSMINPIYNATTADAAQAAYDAIIDGSSVSTAAGFIFKAVPYQALWNYYLDPASSPDLSAFSGAACAAASGTCFTIDLVVNTASPGGSTFDFVSGNFGPFTAETGPINTTSGNVTWSPGCFYATDPAGWTFQVLIGHARFQHRAGGPSSPTSFTVDTNFGVDGVQHALTTAGCWCLIGDHGGRVRICKT